MTWLTLTLLGTTRIKSAHKYVGEIDPWSLQYMTSNMTGINFTNVLHAAFTFTDFKCAKRHWRLDCHFALLRSAFLKASCKYVGEIDPLYNLDAKLFN